MNGPIDEVTTFDNSNCSRNPYPTPLFEGTKTSKCPMPCNITYTNTVLTSVQDSKDDMIHLAFDNKVLVTSITVDTFKLMESLNFFGSNLGLWPGLGIFQLLEWFLEDIVLKINIKTVLKWKCKYNK